MTEPEEKTTYSRYARFLGAVVMTAFVVGFCAAVVFLVCWLYLALT